MFWHKITTGSVQTLFWILLPQSWLGLSQDQPSHLQLHHHQSSLQRASIIPCAHMPRPQQYLLVSLQGKGHLELSKTLQ